MLPQGTKRIPRIAAEKEERVPKSQPRISCTHKPHNTMAHSEVLKIGTHLDSRESFHSAAWLIVSGDEAKKTRSSRHYDTHKPYSAILRSVLEIGKLGSRFQWSVRHKSDPHLT